MTVNELINKLKTYHGDMRVVVNGYEGGVGDITEFEQGEMALDVNKEQWYYGDHEMIGDVINTRTDFTGHKIVKGVVIR